MTVAKTILLTHGPPPPCLAALPPTFSANATNAAKNTVATFMQAGRYTLTATITDGAALSTASTITVTVAAGLTAGYDASQGYLLITGTDGNDAIYVAKQRPDHGRRHCRIVNTSRVARIVARALGGNDSVDLRGFKRFIGSLGRDWGRHCLWWQRERLDLRPRWK